MVSQLRRLNLPPKSHIFHPPQAQPIPTASSPIAKKVATDIFLEYSWFCEEHALGGTLELLLSLPPPSFGAHQYHG